MLLDRNDSDGPSSPRCSIEFHPEDSHGTPISPYERVMRLTRLSLSLSLSFPSISISSFPRATVSSRLKLLQITSSTMRWNYLVRWTAFVLFVPTSSLKDLKSLDRPTFFGKERYKNRDSFLSTFGVIFIFSFRE